MSYPNLLYSILFRQEQHVNDENTKFGSLILCNNRGMVTDKNSFRNFNNIQLSLFIEMFVVIKLRKKFLFPKKATMKVPMAVKNAISEAIKEKVNYEKLL